MADAFDRARSFLGSAARPLEAARFRYHFQGAPAEDALARLEEYRNPDGGFGLAFEPDLRAPESSVLATSVALQVVRELCISADATGEALAFLEDRYARNQRSWRIIPPTAEASPHAPTGGVSACQSHPGPWTNSAHLRRITST